MSLAPGTILGPYQVLALLGAGGMGEVYRARDTKLGRDVAIKVMREAFASDHNRLARFTREAQTLASLNHPNIAVIFGFDRLPATTSGELGQGSEESVAFLVMELVEGFDLTVQIARGPIPIGEVVAIARQIAEALEAAHEQGIVHRDLKPANIKVRSDGTVKVLDFGLAKAMDPEAASTPNLSHSPTLTSQGASGLIVGTAAYMSPEQAKGKAVDRRTDIWAFGVVLHEMLTGRRVFGGDDVSEILASVLKDAVSLDALPAATPLRLKRLIERCLDRDIKTRLRDIGEARVKLARLEAGEPATAGATPATLAGDSARRRVLPWVLAALPSAGLVAALAIWAPWRPPPEPATPVRLSVELGADVSLMTGFGPGAILSPDGKVLAFWAKKTGDGPRQLYVRRLNQLQASVLAGTDGTRHPFFSPDSQWLGFFADGKLKKVAVAGGAPVTLCDAPIDRGGTWSEDGTIIFAPLNTSGGLSRVSSAGGAPEVFTTPDPAAGESTHRFPQALPGGKAVLYTAGSSPNFEAATLVVQSLRQGPRKVVLRGGYHGRYLRSGHLVYIHEGTLLATPFDLERLEVAGSPAPVLEGVTATPMNAGAQIAFSERGSLVFLPGKSLGPAVPILWMDKDGKTEPLRALAGDYNNIRFSPDGQKLALDLRDGKDLDVWVYEWGRDTMSRLTIDPEEDSRPVWTPDGRRIAFSSQRADKATPNLYWQRADGSGQAQRLTLSQKPQFAASWHPSGKILAFQERGEKTGGDIFILPIDGDEASGWKPGTPTAVLNGPFNESEPAFSPDGRWIAYVSNESGRPEVYVRSFPGPGGKWQISAVGGTLPTWSRDGKELFYRNPETISLMVARYAVSGDSFRAEKPRQWSPGGAPLRGPRPFDLHPDGQRFAVLKAVEEPEEKLDKIVLIQNFFEELQQLAPAKKR